MLELILTATCLLLQSPSAEERGRQIQDMLVRASQGDAASSHAVRGLGRFGADAAVAVPVLRSLVVDPNTDRTARGAAVCSLLQIGDDLDGLDLIRGLPDEIRFDAVFGVIQYAIDSGGTLFGAEHEPEVLVGLLCETLDQIPDSHPRAAELARACFWLASDAIPDAAAEKLERALLRMADRDPKSAARIAQVIEGGNALTLDTLPEDERRLAAIRLRSDACALIPHEEGALVVTWTFRPVLPWLPGSTAERTLHLRDALTGRRVARIASSGTGRPPVVGLDERRIVAGGGQDDEGQPVAQIVDVEQGRIERSLILPGMRAVISALAARDGVVIVARYRELYRYALDEDDGEPHRIATDYSGQGVTVEILPGARRFVVPGRDHALEIREVSTGELVERLEGHETTVLAIDAEGGRIASSDRQGELILWDADALEPIRRLESSPPGVWSVDLTADGAFLAAGSGAVYRNGASVYPEHDGRVRVFDTGTGECVARFATFPDHIGHVLMGDDGRHVFATGNRYVYAWEVPERE